MDITHDVNKTIRLLTRSDKLITNSIRSAMSSCRLQIWRPTTSPSPSTWPPLRTWFTLPSVNRPFYENDSFILDRNCETRTLKETLKKKIRAKFVYLTILKVIDKCFKWKSAYHLEDITECSKFPRFLFQFFHFYSKHVKNMSFTEIHIAPRQRTLSIIPIVLKFSLLFRDSVLFHESIKKNRQKSKKKLESLLCLTKF